MIKAQGVSVVAQLSFSEKCASVQRLIYFNVTSPDRSISPQHRP